MPDNTSNIKELLNSIIIDIAKTIHTEVQITIYTQLKNLIEHANKLEYLTDGGMCIREATPEEKFNFIAAGLDEVIAATKQVHNAYFKAEDKEEKNDKENL